MTAEVGVRGVFKTKRGEALVVVESYSTTKCNRCYYRNKESCFLDAQSCEPRTRQDGKDVFFVRVMNHEQS